MFVRYCSLPNVLCAMFITSCSLRNVSSSVNDPHWHTTQKRLNKQCKITRQLKAQKVYLAQKSTFRTEPSILRNNQMQLHYLCCFFPINWTANALQIIINCSQIQSHETTWVAYANIPHFFCNLILKIVFYGNTDLLTWSLVI